jgi:hypothetical protein
MGEGMRHWRQRLIARICCCRLPLLYLAQSYMQHGGNGLAVAALLASLLAPSAARDGRRQRAAARQQQRWAGAAAARKASA